MKVKSVKHKKQIQEYITIIKKNTRKIKKNSYVKKVFFIKVKRNVQFVTYPTEVFNLCFV